jgi:DNA repair exonuclease SbcCD nuclease subunit
MRTLIVGDLHIEERAIAEIDKIFEKDILPIEADKFVQLGDWFHYNRPTPLELVYSVKLVAKLKHFYKEVVILSGTGEHDLLHDESVVSHLTSLGVKTVKGDYIDNNVFYGHFMLHESRFAFGTGRMGIKDLEKYKFVFLGHQHSPEVLVPIKMYHVGSILYTSFSEVGDNKEVVLLEDNGVPQFISLKAMIPMMDVTDVTDLEAIVPMTKVRVIFNSFEDYKKNASYVNKMGKRFFAFKIKMNFEESKILDIGAKKLDSNMNKSNVIQSYIDKIEDKDVRELLDKQFKETI